MPTIGVQELRERAAEVLSQIREAQAEYIITDQGEPVALLLPINSEAPEAAMPPAGKQGVTDGWETYRRAMEQVRQGWPTDKSTQELIDEIRR
jgi:prevent-host-death family protein